MTTDKKKKDTKKSDTGSASDKQGIVGQKRFALWASEAGITANPADEDRAGWDFVVDLPPESPHERAVTCKVQIKTTGPDSESIQIKLSNWRTMIWDALAWFIVIIRVREDGATDEIRLVMVEGEVVKNAVKALSKVKGDTKLNKKRLALSAASGVPVTGEVPQRELFALMRKAIGDPLAHVQRKAETLAAARKATPESYGTLVMQYRNESDFHREAAEFAVGLRSELAIKRFTFSERILGVAGKELADHNGGMLRLSALPSSEKAQVVVFHPSAGARVSRVFDIHSSLRVFPFLPEEFALVRLTSPLVSMLLKVQTRHVSFQWSTESLRQRIDPQVMGEAAEFFLELASFPLPDSRIEVTFPRASRPLVVANVASNETTVDGVLREQLTTLRDAWRILHRLGVKSDLVDASELLNSADQINAIKSVLFGNPRNWQASCEVFEPEELIKQNKPIAFVVVLGFATIQHAVLVALSISGLPQRVAGTQRVEMTTPSAELVGSEVVARSATAGVVQALRARAEKLVEARGFSVIVSSTD